jgi:hypothetical protein
MPGPVLLLRISTKEPQAVMVLRPNDCASYIITQCTVISDYHEPNQDELATITCIIKIRIITFIITDNVIYGRYW